MWIVSLSFRLYKPFVLKVLSHFKENLFFTEIS